MALFRREKLHERLARAAEVEAHAGTGTIDPRPRLTEAGIHGLARPREWDGVVIVDAPELRGDALQFAALQDGTILEEDNPTEQDLSGLADAVEQAIALPYRAQAVRRQGSTWVVGARRLRLAEIPDAPGEEMTLTVRDAVRELVVDRGRAFGSIPALEALGGRHEAFVVEATRLDEDTFEYRLTPL